MRLYRISAVPVEVEAPGTWMALSLRRLTSVKTVGMGVGVRVVVPPEARVMSWLHAPARTVVRVPPTLCRVTEVTWPALPALGATSKADLRALLRAEPKLILGVLVFIAAAVAARRGSRKAIRSQDFGTWLWDESSRQG